MVCKAGKQSTEVAACVGMREHVIVRKNRMNVEDEPELSERKNDCFEERVIEDLLREI